MLIERNQMKWICLIATLSTSICNPLISKESVETSIEDKIKKLEEDSGIDVQPERTTVFFFGEFIYWKASLDGVAYATTADVELSPTDNIVLNNFKTRTVHFDYSPAFQIGMGVGLPHDHWDVSAQWLRSHSSGDDTAHGNLTGVPGNKLIFDSIGLIEGLDTPPNKVTADCSVHLDIVDVVMGRAFLWSRYFWFRPFAGVRGAWLKLDWDISFRRPIVTPAPITQSFTDLDVDNNYSAVGFVGGFESKWNLYKGFGLFSHASASLVFGESSEKTKQKFFRIRAEESEVFEQTLNARNSTHAVKGLFDIAVGIKWETDVYKTKHIHVWAGYDFFYWPNVTQKTIVQSTRVRDRADLSFQGLILGARVDF